MNKLSRFLPILALLGLGATAALGAADLPANVPAAQMSPAQQVPEVPDWMNPNKPIQTTSCSARTKCYAYPFNWVSCTGEFDCYTSNGCYVYCDGYQYDCNPFYLCP